MKKGQIVLIFIFVAALITRFIFFFDSTYFGFDEARDAFTSQAIYLNHDLKLIGPPANAPGLFHGPMFWYLLGPIYLIGHGSPYFASMIFRIINSLGVLLIFIIVKKLFNQKTALIAAAIFAFSFEESQYAMYVGHPSLVIFAWMAVFGGAVILLKNSKSFWGLPLLLGGAAMGAQLEFPFFILLPTSWLLVILLRKQLPKVKLKSWMVAIFAVCLFLSTYLVAELKYNFRSLKTVIKLVEGGYSVIDKGESKYELFFKQFLRLFHDNVFPLSGIWLILLVLLIILGLIVSFKKDKSLGLVLIWIFGGLWLLPLGAYNAYYINVGIGVGIIIGTAYLVNKLWNFNKYLGIFILLLILSGNFWQIINNNKNGLIVDIKAQTYMRLPDEIKIVKETYNQSQDNGFTVRATSMPYGIPTVWAYLYQTYGQKQYGYLPYWQTGSVIGFPGNLPSPKDGSTCHRFLIQEPVRGIPDSLIKGDITEENYFSKVVDQQNINHFVLQVRQSTDSTCHNNKPS